MENEPVHFKHGRYSKEWFYRDVHRYLFPGQRQRTRRCMAFTKKGTHCRQWAFGPTLNTLPRCFAHRWLTFDDLYEMHFGRRRRKPNVEDSRVLSDKEIGGCAGRTHRVAI
jgi:hypothetical protein